MDQLFQKLCWQVDSSLIGKYLGHTKVQVLSARSGHIQAKCRYQATTKCTHKYRYQATYPSAHTSAGTRPHTGHTQVSGHIQVHTQVQVSGHISKCTHKCRYWSDNIQTQLAIGHTQDISNQLQMSLLFIFPSTILSSNSQELYELCWRKCTIMVLFLINSLTGSALSHGVLAMILCFRISQKA